MIPSKKKHPINPVLLTNLVFGFFPISFILGSLIVNMNLLLFCCLGIFYLRTKILTIKFDFPIKIIFLFFFIIFFSTILSLIRSILPHASITTDVIVGFPGENDRAFSDTYSFCQNMQFSAMHVFPYSVRQGTSAAYYKGQVSALKKKQRVQQMIQLSDEQKATFKESSIGEIRNVLWESALKVGDIDIWSGLTDNYLRVFFRDSNGSVLSTNAQISLSNEWHHVAVTWDGENWRQYVDGVEGVRSGLRSSGAGWDLTLELRVRSTRRGPGRWGNAEWTRQGQ